MPRITVPTDKKTCDSMLAEIESELVAAIPNAVRKKRIKETAYGVLVFYKDLTTDEYTPFAACLPETHRLKCIADRDTSVIWHTHSVPSVDCPLLRGRPLNKRCNAVYEYLSSRSEADDKKVILPFRQMIYRVCLKLNELDWSSILPVTDDFTVMASDWSGFWVKFDAKKSVPTSHQRVLQKKGLFFNSADLPQPKIPSGNPIRLMTKKPPDEQAAYWLSQLESLVQGQICDANIANWGSKRIVNALVELGELGADTLITFVERFAEMSEWKHKRPAKVRDDLGPQSAILCEALKALEQCASRDDETERRLWKIFDRAINVNKSCEYWGSLPAAAAFAIYHVFGHKYNFWVIRDPQNKIKSLAEIAQQRKKLAPKN